MKNEVMVSVVIAVKNGEHTILRQLNALDAQVDAPPFEIIICNNGCTDGTEAVVRRWMDEGDHTAERMSIVDAGAKRGIPYARNCGISMARGGEIAFCDSDDEVDPNWLSALSSALPARGIVGGRIMAREPDGTLREDVFGNGLMDNGYLPFAPTCNFAISKNLAQILHGFDESLPPYGFEDVDISWRAQLSGYPVKYAPNARVLMTLSRPRSAARKKFLLGMGRVLMAHRYPEYDNTEYSTIKCLRDSAAVGASMIQGIIYRNSPRSKLRKQMSYLISSLGRAYGCSRYKILGYPEPCIITSNGRSRTS